MKVSVFSKRVGRFLSLALCICFAAGIGLPAAGGESPEDPAPEGLARAKTLIEEGKYAEAESLARSLLKDAETRHGAESAEAAGVLDELVDSLLKGGKAREEETLRLAQRALAIREAAHGSQSLPVASAINRLGIVHFYRGELQKTRPLFERALAIREKALGPDHPELALSLNSLAVLLRNLGDYEPARPLHERALAIREKALGPDHPVVADSLNNLALLLHDLGDHEAARPLHERSLAIKEKALGPDHPSVATSLLNLAILHDALGDYEAARPLFERSLAIWEKALGPDHPNVALGLNNLATLRVKLGDYEAARPLYERSLAIWGKALGPDHPNVASSLNNLASLLLELGDYEAARPLHQRALAIREKALGPDHPDVALSLNNLAALLYDLDDYEAARSLLERSLAIRGKALGPDHPEEARSLNNLANLLRELGDCEAARPLHQRALSIRERALGPDHPDVAESLSNLANLLRDHGDYEAARPLHQRALSIRGKALGPDHPDVAVSLNNLARLLLARGEEEPAIEASLRAEEISREHLRATSGSLAEREALRYAATRVRGLDVALTVAAGAEASKRWRAWEAGLRSRALVLDEMAGRRRAVLASAEPEVARLRQELASARRRMAHLTVRGLGDEEPAVYRRLLEGARKEKEAAERALARASVEFRKQQELEQSGLAEVRGKLPEDTALVGFFRYLHRPVAVREGQAPPEPVASYLAFVLPAGGGEVQVVSLGAARTIDEQVASWAREAGSPLGDEADLRRAGAGLRRRIWDPLAEHLEGAERVFLVPDGALHLVNFAALPVEEGRYLVEEDRLLHVLSAERDVVALAQAQEPGKGLVAVGGPDFEETSLFAALRKLLPGNEVHERRLPLPRLRPFARRSQRSPGSVRSVEAARHRAGRRPPLPSAGGGGLGDSLPPPGPGQAGPAPGHPRLLPRRERRGNRRHPGGGRGAAAGREEPLRTRACHHRLREPPVALRPGAGRGEPSPARRAG